MRELSEEDARHAIAEGDFPGTITGGARVAVVMTQNWCPDWLFMRSWLNRMQRNGQPANENIDVYVLVYNKLAIFREFMGHKEEVFGNGLIPYVRYYSNGEYLGEDNRVGSDRFLRRFDELSSSR